MYKHWMDVRLPIIISLIAIVCSQRRLRIGASRYIEEGRCYCTEYWDCVTRGGKPTSYCGPSENQVCCFVPRNARPVGILPPTPAKRTQCGRKGSVTAMAADQDGYTELGEWPWQAAILEKSKDTYVCGASLLDERWLLTAAHCINSDPTKQQQLKIRLGEYNVSDPTERPSYEEFDVDLSIAHPNFINTTLLNDIALLRLAQRAKKRPHIDIICMPTSDIDDNTANQQRCLITGWGRTSEGSEHSQVLKEIAVPLWNNSACQNSLRTQFGPSFALPQTAICAGAESKDACDGDGGGPLVCERNGRWEQVGVISYGVSCGLPNLPGVYTRVLAYSAWIKQTIRSNSQRST